MYWENKYRQLRGEIKETKSRGGRRIQRGQVYVRRFIFITIILCLLRICSSHGTPCRLFLMLSSAYNYSHTAENIRIQCSDERSESSQSKRLKSGAVHVLNIVFAFRNNQIHKRSACFP